MELAMEVKQAETFVHETIKVNRHYYHGKNPILSYDAECCLRRLRYLRSRLKHQELSQ